MATVVFFPEGAYGPTNNCVGIGAGAARARPPGRVHRRGVVRRHPRGAGVRGAAHAARAAARGRGGARPVLEGLHPRHGARLPQADDRAARRVHRARPGEALIDGARYVDAAARARSSASSSRTSSSRTTSSASRRSRRAAGRGSRIVSCNPLEIKDPASRRSSPATRPTTASAGTSSAPRTTARTASSGPSSTRSAARRGAPAAARASSSSTSRPYLNLYVYPDEADYAARGRSAPTWHRLDSCVRAADATASCPTALRERRRAR